MEQKPEPPSRSPPYHWSRRRRGSRRKKMNPICRRNRHRWWLGPSEEKNEYDQCALSSTSRDGSIIIQQRIRSLISYRIQIRTDLLSAKLVPSNSTQFVSVWTNSNRWYLNQIRDLPSEAMIGSSVNSSSSSFLGVIPVRCWSLMVKVSWICYGGWRFCEDDWRSVQWMWLKNRGGRGGWSGGLALPCGASNDEAPTTMEDERVLKVRIECRSFWESGKNRSNPMIGNDCSLYSTIPRANGRIKYESSSWHLSEREGEFLHRELSHVLFFTSLLSKSFAPNFSPQARSLICLQFLPKGRLIVLDESWSMPA